MPFESDVRLTTARDLVETAPIPSWATPCEFDIDFKGRQEDQVTYLLINRQVHAENRQTFFHSAMRLETMQAVQHNSQWQLQFEPRTQKVTLHWIKTRRGDQEFDHINLDKLRLLEREAGLEGFVIDGWFTLLLIFEDIRPGDVIESCYTIEEHPRLLPENFASFFCVPGEFSVGKFAFSLRFNETRQMKWKSSDEILKPSESRSNGEVFWTWTQENCLRQKPEMNTPEWHISYSWIQVSDCLNWQTVATAVSKAWNENSEDSALTEIAKEIAGKETDILLRVGKAIQTVQNEYRYLSVNLEFGGQVPTPPHVVARRRFGDCKDLSFLLVQLLKQWGVSARPILVNTSLRKTVVNMLPMAGLFNHVVVELQIGGETRWIDPTMKFQGGSALERFIPDYGFGLPIDPESPELVEAPRLSSQAGVYELKETILLDTSGASSSLAVVLRATGNHAESLRQKFEMMGEEKFAEERLRLYANRFFNAKRIGPLKFRDDCAANEFFLAEVFEINGFLTAHRPGMCGFFPSNLIATTLLMPEKETRRTPFVLPHPCNIVHTIEVETPTVQPMGGSRSGFESPFIKFNRRAKSLHGYWAAKFTFSTLADSVPSDCIDAHRETIEKIRSESSNGLIIPVGYARPRATKSFAQLPPASRRISAEPKVSPAVNLPAARSRLVQPDLIPSNSALSVGINSKGHVRKRQKQRSIHRNKEFWCVVIAGVLIISFGIWVFVISRNP